jgi:hypothetical protein
VRFNSRMMSWAVIEMQTRSRYVMAARHTAIPRTR